MQFLCAGNRHILQGGTQCFGGYDRTGRFHPRSRASGASAMKNLQIPIPSIPEQNEIVKILVSILEKESRAKEAAQTVLDQIALLKKSILARAFRGKI